MKEIINDYLVITNAEQSEIYHNIDLFYDLSLLLEIGLPEYFNEPINYNKITNISFFDKIELIQNFYKKIEVNFDLDKYINDGTIDFIYYDYINNNEDSEKVKYPFGNGKCYYETSKRLVDSSNNGLITDVPLVIHELSHFRNQPNSGRNEISQLLTESVAYAEELICIDYLLDLGYEEDMNIWKKYLFTFFYNQAKHSRLIYKIILVHKELGNISEENYEYYFKTKDEYESTIKYVSRYVSRLVEENDFQLYDESSYVMGAILGIYMYIQYKKDKSFFKNIVELHQRINDSDASVCFKVIGLKDLGDEDKAKLNNALNEIKLELNEIDYKQSK